MRFDKNMSQPGDLVTLTLKSDPYSVVSICVIDKSVESLEKPNELTDELVQSQMQSYKLTPFYHQVYFGYMVIPEPQWIFESKGLIVLTDLDSLRPTFQESMLSDIISL